MAKGPSSAFTSSVFLSNIPSYSTPPSHQPAHTPSPANIRQKRPFIHESVQSSCAMADPWLSPPTSPMSKCEQTKMNGLECNVGSDPAAVGHWLPVTFFPILYWQLLELFIHLLVEMISQEEWPESEECVHFLRLSNSQSLSLCGRMTSQRAADTRINLCFEHIR